MDFEIRDIRPGESNKLNRLACPNFSFVEQIFMPKPKLGILAQTADGSIAGAAFLVIVESKGKRIGCIDIIFVLPKYRGSGVAKLLYSKAVEKLHHNGCETVMALVRGDNSQSLKRFEAEGLHPISLKGLVKKVGLSTTISLFFKTSSLACATGCWILCENTNIDDIGTSTNNILRMFLINGFLCLCGALIGSIINKTSLPWWNLLAALLFLGVILTGESIGKKVIGGDWTFVLPEGGLIPTAVVALFGGLYPMVGHWYLTKRDNSKEYQKKMAAPAIGAWIAVMITTLICGILNKIHFIFSCGVDLGVMLLLFYMLPFYPFNTFGGKRIQEYNDRIYYVLTTFSIITIAVTFMDI